MAMAASQVAYSSPAYLKNLDAYWRAANYISVGQLYLKDNPLLKEPVKPSDLKENRSGTGGRFQGRTLFTPI